jgi:hypothetical protein
MIEIEIVLTRTVSIQMVVQVLRHTLTVVMGPDRRGSRTGVPTKAIIVTLARADTLGSCTSIRLLEAMWVLVDRPGVATVTLGMEMVVITMVAIAVTVEGTVDTTIVTVIGTTDHLHLPAIVAGERH